MHERGTGPLAGWLGHIDMVIGHFVPENRLGTLAPFHHDVDA